MIFASSATVCRLVCKKASITTLFHPANPAVSTHFAPVAMTIINHRNVRTSTVSEAATNTKTNGVSSATKSNINVNSLDKNIELRRRFSSSVANEASSSDSDSDSQNDHKRLAIIFAYMLPKDKHLDKYRSIYFNKGFDVVTVKTSPFEFFFPTIGAHKIADNLIDQLMHQPSLSKYSDIVVHGFSVGGYQFSEVLKKLRPRATTEAGEKIGEKMERVTKSIKGTIFDSPCDVDSVPFGFSRTVAGESFLARVIEMLIIVTRSIFYPVSTKYHRSGFEEFKNNPIPVPSLFFASKKDKLANIHVIEDVVRSWEEKGIDVDLK